MFKRSLFILIELGVICIALIAVGLLGASYYVDTEDFRRNFSSIIANATGRNVELKGDIDVALWPGLVLNVEDLSVSETPDFGGGQFVHFDRVRVSIRLIPLLSESLHIRTVIVEGMDLSIIQDAGGRFNWQSIWDKHDAGSKEEGASGVAFEQISLSGVEVLNASITYKDGSGDQGYVLSGINLRTGAIALGGNIPFTLNSAFSWVDGGIESNLILKGLVETIGEEANLSLKDATLYASVGGPFLPEGASPGELTARVVMDWDHRTVALSGLRVKFLGLRAEGNIESADLRKKLSAKGHITVHPFEPSTLITRYFPKAPVDQVTGLKSSAFASFFHVTESGVFFKDLALTLDDITVRGDISFTDYSWPVFNFDLRGNTIDLDRYLTLFKTDTPFIWDDFNLPLFKLFRGHGAVRADGVKVLETLVSDIRLTVNADNKSIVIDAGAIKKGQASLGGKTEIAIGVNNDGIPNLTLSAHITAESQKDGFAFLKSEPISISGSGVVDVKTKITQMPCPPEARSIDILRYLEGNASLSLGKGSARRFSSGKNTVLLDYSKANLLLHATPVKGLSKEFFDYDIGIDLQTRGGKDIESLTFTTQGALVTAVDAVHVKSSGMDIKGHLMSAFLPKEAKRVDISATIAFDSLAAQVSINDGLMRVLETPIQGSAKISGLNSNAEATGHLEIPEANPKRIIYLLSNYSVRTKDIEALKKAGVQTNYKIDKNGFTCSDLEGDLDGMSFEGHVVGRGLVNPKLSFSFAAGTFDLDRYLPPSRNVSLEERRSGKVIKAPPVDLPLGFLRALQLNGKGFFEEFKLADIRSRSISANIKASAGNIHISDVKGVIHTGQLTADLKAEVGEKDLTAGLKLHVEDMQLGPLLIDMAQRDYIRGETDVDVDLSSKGSTDDDILKNLNGKTWARTRNGSFKFSGYNNHLSSSESNVDILKRSTQVQPRPRTVFRKAQGYFTVKDGVFTVDKFRLEAPPLLQSFGEGSFSLPDNSINLSVKNDFVAVPSITIQIVGSLVDPEINVPKGKILNDTVRNILSLPEKSFNFLRDLFH